jgi:SAM-dependent methyltransferase
VTPLEAELYALTHRGHPGDAAFYAKACASARSVLELGVGYGRLICGLAAAHRRLVGLDREPALLRLARARARREGVPAATVRWVLGDMQSFSLGETFDRIILPYSGLYCLPGRRGRARCFERVRAHLAPEGEFYFDVWSSEAFESRSQEHPDAFRDDVAPVVTFQHRDQLWDVFERSRWRRARRRLDVTYHYASRSRDVRKESHVSHSYATRAELEASLAAAGMQVAQIWGNFSRGRFTRRSEWLVVRAIGR